MWTTGETRISEHDAESDWKRRLQFREWYLSKCKHLNEEIGEKKIPLSRLRVLKDWAHHHWYLMRDPVPAPNAELFWVDLLNSASYLSLLVHREPYYKDISDERSFREVPPERPNFDHSYLLGIELTHSAPVSRRDEIKYP